MDIQTLALDFVKIKYREHCKNFFVITDAIDEAKEGIGAGLYGGRLC
jgi:hypothetical protein